ncbi:MAG: ABC transporter permease subunit [Gammaproteobacteria bacterium]|nr:ABC transporter permease subunit [Gammaproteobacteria bacterium]
MREALLGTPLARICCAVLLLVVLAAITGPWLSPWDFDAVDWDAIDAAPSAVHWFGTDGVGRDLLVRTLTGARLSIVIALAATLVSCLIGIPWGATAGYVGGAADMTMMRVVDGLYALPFILLVILLVVLFGRNIVLLFAALGAVSWLDLARIVRGQTLAAKNEAYVEAARAMGVRTPGIIKRHIVPNVIGPALVYATLTVPGVIIAESFLSFLGLGVQEPQTSWGVLIADGAREMRSAPWQLAFPATMLAVTLFALNVLGDRLRDALDRRHSSAT